MIHRADARYANLILDNADDIARQFQFRYHQRWITKIRAKLKDRDICKYALGPQETPQPGVLPLDHPLNTIVRKHVAGR